MIHPARILLALFLLLPLSLSAQTPNTSSKVIAFAQDTLANDFRRAQVFEVRDAVAAHPNLTFVYSDAKGKTSLLIRQIEQFIRDKVDLLVLGTSDERAVVPVVARAYRAGIPVIVLDRGIKGEEYTSFINSDNLLIGRLGAEAIVERLGGKGRVLLFEGLQTADVTQLRSQGFMQAMAEHPDIEVIKRTGNYLRKDAVLEMEKLLAEGIEIDAIYSESDSMLSGVRLVLERHAIDPASLITIGTDYTTEAANAIRQGKQTGSIKFPLGGHETVETALKIFAGETVDKHIVIPVKLVTQENVDVVDPIF